MLNYSDLLEQVSMPIIGLGFSRKLLKRTGSFNDRLQAETNFELLSRLTKVAGKCTIYPIGNDMVESLYDEASAYTFAYMIRYHMNALRDSGKLERVFQSYCNLMQLHGLFSCLQQYMNRFLAEEGLYENIARNTTPFVVLRGDDTCGGVLQNFADRLAESLMAHGQAVIVVDGAFTEYESLQNNIYKGIVGFQTKALEIDFFRKMNGTKFQFWFDYPLCFENIMRNLSEDYYVLVQDADYAALVRKYCHTENAIQFPPAGIDGGCAEQPERPYDLFLWEIILRRI